MIGAEGASTPCGYAFIDTGSSGPRSGPARLALGIARAAPPPEESIGTADYALAVKAAVETGLRDGGISPADAEVVIVNVPQPTSGDIGLRGRRGRAAAALGAGLALGELAAEQVRDETIVTDGALFTPRVQTFTGPAIPNLEIIVIGNAPASGGNLFACNTITSDLLDARSVKRMLVKAGLRSIGMANSTPAGSSRQSPSLALIRAAGYPARPPPSSTPRHRRKNTSERRFQAFLAQRCTRRAYSARSTRCNRLRSAAERSAALFATAGNHNSREESSER